VPCRLVAVAVYEAINPLGSMKAPKVTSLNEPPAETTALTGAGGVTAAPAVDFWKVRGETYEAIMHS